MVEDGHVRKHDTVSVIARLLGHRDTGRATWERIRADWDKVIAYPPPQSRQRILDLIHYRSEPDVAEDIVSWLAENPISGAEMHVAQQLERLGVRVGLRRRQSERESLLDD